jgi:putative FmdB family regulatory protein
MPIYEYQRDDGTIFEVIQHIHDAPLSRCPQTGQAVRRIFSPVAPPIFKGSGFYQTDYKKKKREE